MKRVSKNSGLVKDGSAPGVFLRKITDFKRKKRYHRFISVEPIFLKGKSKKAFDNTVFALEKFRVHLGMNVSIFYKLVSEFILIPSGRKYYPLRMVFVEKENQVSEEFIIRVVDTLTWISDLTGRNYNNDHLVKSILAFSRELSDRKISTANISFKSKDWYCVVAIKEMGQKKGWIETELLDRIRRFYKRKIKKVTVEMVLCDLIHGELDKMESQTPERKQNQKKSEKKKIEKIKIKKPVIEEYIESQSWYDSK